MWENYTHSFAKMIKEGSGNIYISIKRVFVYDLCTIFIGS